jgi:hypothetical protein
VTGLAVDTARAEISGPDESIRALLAGDEPIELEPLRVVEAGNVTHLRYRVVRDG